MRYDTNSLVTPEDGTPPENQNTVMENPPTESQAVHYLLLVQKLVVMKIIIEKVIYLQQLLLNVMIRDLFVLPEDNNKTIKIILYNKYINESARIIEK